MKKQTKIENLIQKKLLRLHDRKIDLSLDRIHRLNQDLKINIDKLIFSYFISIFVEYFLQFIISFISKYQIIFIHEFSWT